MYGIEFGVTCEGCFDRKPDIRYAADVRKHLCGPCWADTPPKGGVQKSGFRDRPVKDDVQEF